ncbi:MoaD/ThiS family protein [Limosilactobacillus fermentum]
MKVTVKLFAFLGERLGPAVEIDVPKSVTQAALKDAVLELDPALEATLAGSSSSTACFNAACVTDLGTSISTAGPTLPKRRTV